MTSPGRIPRDAFADRLAGLEPVEFTAFVEDLLEARGRQRRGRRSAREGVTVVEFGGAGDDQGQHSVAVVAPPDALPADDGSLPADLVEDDLVVAVRRTAGLERFATARGVDVVDADGLYDRLLYGIDRDVADDLCREHLGRPVAAAPSERSVPAGGGVVPPDDGRESADSRSEPPTDGRPDAPAGRPWRRSPHRRHVVAALTVVVAVALVAAGAGAGFGGWPLAADGPVDGSDAAGNPGASTATAAEPPRSTTASPTVDESPAADEDRGANATGTASPAAVGWLDRRYVEMRPTCARPPGLVAVVIVGALRNNDPASDDGIRTAWNFSSRASVGSNYRSFSEFLAEDRFDPLFDHRRAAFAPVYREPGIAAFDVTVTTADGGRHTYLMAFTNEAVDTARGSVPVRDVGEEEGCWRLAGIMPR